MFLSPTDFTDFTDLATRYACPFVASVGNVLFSHGFHRFPQIWLHVIRAHLWHQWEYFFSHGFSQIWLHVISVHLWHQWEMFFSPTDFTDLHGFGYMLSVFICIISGKYLSSHGFHRFARIWLHVIRVHLCHQWGMFFFFTDFTDFHRFGYMLSVFICVISGKCSFLPRISLICTDLIINYPWVLCLWVK